MSKRAEDQNKARAEAEKRIEMCLREGGTMLHLNNIGLESLPERVRSLTKLEMLSIHNNQIPHLPDWLQELRELRQIDWYANGTITLPDCLAALRRLEELTVGGGNTLKNLGVLGKLRSLRGLHLGGLANAEVPDSLRGASHLRELFLGNTRLGSLPDWAGDWTGLETLELERTALTTLPPTFSKLTNLRKLDLGYNNFTTLPPALLALDKLERLHLEGNPLPDLPKELIASNDAQRILAIYRRTREPAETRPLREVKVLVVGQGEVGKTSLIRQLLGEPHDPGERKTEGIVRRQLPMECKSKGSVKLNVWDFGGQEIMHSTHQFFLTARSVYLLVLDSRQDERASRVEYWLRLIESFGGDSPVIVVCNKYDEQRMNLAWDTLQKKFPQIKAYVREVSCQGNAQKRIAPGHGIGDVKAAIAAVIDKHVEQVDRPFRNEWFELKEALEGDARSFLTYEQYEALCVEKKVEGQDRAALLGYLNDLGVMLYFGDSPLMKDKHVLQPDWVTAAIYRALNDNELGKNHGKLSRVDLRRILASVKEHNYPPGHEEFIVEMMKKFQLCFPFDEGDTVLMPDLLQKDAPALWFEPGALAFQYRYPVLPGSVVSRFIVRQHVLVPKHCYWLTGVVLEREGNRARIVADLEDGHIDIRIDGSAEGRRRLLAIIRAEFESIHATFPNRLNATEWVPVPFYEEELLEYETLLKAESEGETTFYTKSRGKVPLRELLGGVVDRGQPGGAWLVSQWERTGVPRVERNEMMANIRVADQTEPAKWWPVVLGTAVGSGLLALVMVYVESLGVRIFVGVAAIAAVFMFARNPQYHYRRMACSAFGAMVGVNALGFALNAKVSLPGLDAQLKWDAQTSGAFSVSCLIVVILFAILDYKQHHRR